MQPKSARNWIITLIILAIGVKALVYATAHFVDISAAGELGKFLNDTGNLLIYGFVILAIILIPFYLSARSDERKNART